MALICTLNLGKTLSFSPENNGVFNQVVASRSKELSGSIWKGCRSVVCPLSHWQALWYPLKAKSSGPLEEGRPWGALLPVLLTFFDGNLP